MFKIDLIVWKSEEQEAFLTKEIKFKIDLIVWKYNDGTADFEVLLPV